MRVMDDAKDIASFFDGVMMCARPERAPTPFHCQLVLQVSDDGRTPAWIGRVQVPSGREIALLATKKYGCMRGILETDARVEWKARDRSIIDRSFRDRSCSFLDVVCCEQAAASSPDDAR
jgi:hypothetical protein